MHPNSTAAQLIVGIIVEEMCLPPANVWLRDQNALFPNDNQLYIVVGMVDSHPMSNESYMRPATAEDWDYKNQRWDVCGQAWDANGNLLRYDEPNQDWDTPGQTFDQLPPTQIQISTVQTRELIQIDVLCRGNDALFRNWEVVAALQSIYAEQQQESNSFKIFRIPSGFVNTSVAEGGSDLNRYTLTFSAFVWYRKAKVLTLNGGDYYDDFHQRVDNYKTIASTVTNYDTGTDTFDEAGGTYDQPLPMAEFEINQQGVVPP